MKEATLRWARAQRCHFSSLGLWKTSPVALLALTLAAGCAVGTDGADVSSEEADSPPRLLPDFWDDLFSAWRGETDAGAGAPGVSDGGTSWGGSGPSERQLPRVNGPCPDLRDGYVNVGGASVWLTVGSGPGPLLFYWHGTGTSSDEVDLALPGATLDIKLTGGIVASFEDTSGLGDNTGDLWWYTGDFDAADQLVACGIQAGLVDPSRIYTAGYSAGGLQSGAMVFSRSGYLASAVVYSGGPALGGLVPGSTWFADSSNIPAVLGAHGAAGSDSLVLDFADGTHRVEDAVTAAGGYAIDCDDGGDHAISWFFVRAGVDGMAWKFLKDHPYGVRPDSYRTLPAGFPDYCTIVR